MQEERLNNVEGFIIGRSAVPDIAEQFRPVEVREVF
jgi:hypothetical protein